MAPRPRQALEAGVLAFVLYLLVRLLRGGPVPAVAPAPTEPLAWPPLPIDAGALGAEGASVDTEPLPGPIPVLVGQDDEDQPSLFTEQPDAWVLPTEGACPLTHPVKGKLSSGIFHVPGGLSYERTMADRCYRSESDAVEDGLRQAKR